MRKHTLSLAGVWLSVLLVAMKLWAGIVSGSAAVIADALNAILDVFAYGALHISVRVQEDEPDASHPFGHRRAEPMAGLVIAIFAGVLGLSILNHAIGALRDPPPVTATAAVIGVVAATIVLKAGITALYLREAQHSDSVAMRASYIDSRNDIFTSVVALMGLVVGGFWDAGAALAVGAWVLYSGLHIGLENVGYLMGEAPDDDLQQAIRRLAEETPGVLGSNTLRAHMVGDRVHVEIHIEVAGSTPLERAHDIGTAVSQRLETIDSVNRAFVHIDPVGAGKGGGDEAGGAGAVSETAKEDGLSGGGSKGE